MHDDVNLSEAEATATTAPTVVAGLGYPNGRDTLSPEPTGWINPAGEVSVIEQKVSRETSR
jgi:hypothetical protein